MTILVTGGAGYIGSHMVHELRDAGEKLVVIDNLSTGFRWAVPADVPLVVGDVGDQRLVEALIVEHGITEIIHFAGSIIVPESVSNPLKYYKNNTAASRTLIEAAVNRGVRRFIFSSTAAVYGNPDTTPVAETAPLSPMSPYGTSKLMTEMMLQDVAGAHAFDFVALRYFNVAGADPQGRSGQSTPQATHLIKVACETALGKRSHMQVFGTDYDTADGTCVRDYIHVMDLAEAHVAALRALQLGSSAGHYDVFNVGTGQGASVLEVVRAFEDVTGQKLNYSIGPRRPGDVVAVYADATKAHEQLGWTAKRGLREALADAWRWEQGLVAS